MFIEVLKIRERGVSIKYGVIKKNIYFYFIFKFDDKGRYLYKES